jgi:hypothetical protein
MQEYEATNDPAFVQGQIAGLRALVIAVAVLLPEDEFFASFRARFDALYAGTLPEPVAEAFFAGVRTTEQVVEQIRQG